jgi:hypothetical protein
VISRGTTVASGNETQFTDEDIFVYYCVCGALCLSTDTPLEKLPRRKTDNAHILQAGKNHFRFKTKSLDPITLKRDKGFEKQFRSGCVECGLPVSYSPKEKNSPITYVFPGALHVQDYGATTDPLPLEAIKEMPWVEYEEYVAEKRKEQQREDDSGAAAQAKPLRLSDLPRHEQERQIREKLKALERGDDDEPIQSSSSSAGPSTTASSSSHGIISPSSSSSAPKETNKRSPEREGRQRKRSRERDEGDERRGRSGSHEKKQRSRSRSRSRSRGRDRRGRGSSPHEKKRRSPSRSRSRSRGRDRH